MKINIEQIESDELQKQLLQHDTDQNHFITQNDFVTEFGYTAVQKFEQDLQFYITNEDLSGTLTTIEKMRSSRDQLIKTTFAPFAKMVLEKGKSTNPEFQKILLAKMDAFTLAEFNIDIDAQTNPALQSALEYIDEDGFNAKILLFSALSNDPFYPSNYSMSLYAAEEYFEINTQNDITNLENKYAIDLRFQNQLPTESDIQKLDKALARLEALRPDDFVHLTTLSLIYNDEREGGSTKHNIENPDNPGMLIESEDGNLHQIEITGAFAPKDPTGYIDEPYTTESLQSYANDDTVDFIFKFIAHELAHTLSAEHEDFYTELLKEFGLKKNSFVAQFTGGRMVASELFAEHYMSYLASNGQKVSSQLASGETIPMYDERLEYFHTHFPLG